MFEWGFFEIILILIITLVVLGPERLPGALRAIQRGVSKTRQFASRMQAELNHELRVKELHEHLRQAEQLPQDQLPPELQRSIAELRQAAAGVQRPYAKSEAKPPPESSDKPTSDS